MRIDRMKEQHVYFAETAMVQLQLAEKYWKERRVAKAQEHLTEARYWAFKVPAEEFTGTDFTQNLSELERKIFQG